MLRRLPHLTLGYGALLALLLLSRSELAPYDDAFFFLRFARSWLGGGGFSWNVEEGPVYGNTSQLYQLLYVGFTALGPEHTVALGRLFLAGCLAAAAGVLSRGEGRGIPALLLMCSPMAMASALSGMETALTLALGVLFLRALAGEARSDGRLSALAVLLYLARPDTGLLSFASLALARRWRALGLSALGVGAALAALYSYYGTALPLPFYVKSGASGLYDAAFLARSLEAKGRHALFFVLNVAPILALGRAGLPSLPGWLFSAYHLIFTVDVMGLHGRFYAPALPWLAGPARSPLPPRQGLAGWGIWAGVCALCWLQGWIPSARGWPIGRLSAWTWGAFVASALFAALPLRPALKGGLILAATGVGILASGGGWRWPPPSDKEYAEIYSGYVTSWRGAEELRRCLGEELHLYHSEIGVLGLEFPRGRITDLGGLMSPELALEGASVDALCLRDAPDALFLPHKNYAALNRQLLEGECIKNYRIAASEGSSPLYIRADLLGRYRCGEDVPPGGL